MQQTDTPQTAESLALQESPLSSPQTSASRSQLIKEWLFRYGVNWGKSDVAPLESLWLEAFSDLDCQVLAAAFKRALQSCKFFPTVADIRGSIDSAVKNATDNAGELTWQSILELRRLHWNPDIPALLQRALAKLPDRVRQAARAANPFRDFESSDGLHVWAKKRFLESFTAYGERELDQFLLPDGELKNLLAGFASEKALPDSVETWEEMRERGLAYCRQHGSSPVSCRPTPGRFQIASQSTRSIEEQKRILREKGFLPTN